MSQDSATAAPLDLRRIIEVLDRHDVEYVLVGGVAARLHGARRLTMDLDLCPSWHEENLGRLADALNDLGATLKGIPASVSLPPVTAAILRTMEVGPWRTPAGDIDVLQGIPADSHWRLVDFDSLIQRAVERDLAGCTVYVAALDDIVASKRISGRPSDVEALPELETLHNPPGDSSTGVTKPPDPGAVTAYSLPPVQPHSNEELER
ncbi:MAG TPA: hypothetical protein VFW71_06390 [Actinomycetota bacterium]|nr:hypothetical protein [Actinomycetota bacterium]